MKTDTSKTANPKTADPVEVAGRLRLSVTRLARILRHQDAGGLVPTLSSALATIDREGPLTLGTLAVREHVAPPSITKAVVKLEAMGFVERRTDEHRPARSRRRDHARRSPSRHAEPVSADRVAGDAAAGALRRRRRAVGRGGRSVGTARRAASR